MLNLQYVLFICIIFVWNIFYCNKYLASCTRDALKNTCLSVNENCLLLLSAVICQRILITPPDIRQYRNSFGCIPVGTCRQTYVKRRAAEIWLKCFRTVTMMNSHLCIHMHLCAQSHDCTHVSSWNWRLGELLPQQWEVWLLAWPPCCNAQCRLLTLEVLAAYIATVRPGLVTCQ